MFNAVSPLSSGAIALQLLQSAAGRADPFAPQRQQRSDPPVAEVTSSSQSYRDRLADSIRLGHKNAFDVGRQYIDLSYEDAARLSIAMQAQTKAMVKAVPQPLSAFPPEDAVRLQAFGADAAVLNPPVILDDATFFGIVTRNIEEQYASVPGFAEAFAAGTVVIQRASDVPAFNFGHKSYSLYKDGHMIGGAGFGMEYNQALYDDVAATGVQQAFGGMMGADYYMTWPGKAA